MHDTALLSGNSFAEVYCKPGMVVVDIGGRNVNGSLRHKFTKQGAKFVCVDMETDLSVDIVVKPGDPLPFETGSVDIVISTSCFEHDPVFWLTFKEMTRIVRLDGYIYINAPTGGNYHGYPGDNWRFYSDAGQALAYWSSIQNGNETIYPVKVLETFNVLGNTWNDFVCVWQRTTTTTKEITVIKDVLDQIGPLEKYINNRGNRTRKRVL
jgi:SAM-dependent methyltransferase